MRRDARMSSGLFDELIVDSFAGAGGASLGIEQALDELKDNIRHELTKPEE